MRRILPIHWPTVRSTAGNSLGPITTSAITAMMMILPQPRSNIGLSFHDAAESRGRAAGQAVGAACVRAEISTGLMALRLRGDAFGLVVVDGLLLGRGRHRGRLLVVRHALLEGLDALGEVAHERGDFAAPAEQQERDRNDDDPVHDAQRTHRNILRAGAPTLNR